MAQLTAYGKEVKNGNEKGDQKGIVHLQNPQTYHKDQVNPDFYFALGLEITAHRPCQAG